MKTKTHLAVEFQSNYLAVEFQSNFTSKVQRANENTFTFEAFKKYKIHRIIIKPTNVILRFKGNKLGLKTNAVYELELSLEAFFSNVLRFVLKEIN